MKILFGIALVSTMLLTACEREDPVLKALDGWTFVGGQSMTQKLVATME